MIGIKFRIPNKYNTFLGKLLENTFFDNEYWNIIGSEVYKEDGNNLFEKEINYSNEVKNIITSENYYVIFVTMQLYDDKNEITDIKGYNDYLNSNCKLLMTIVDNEFVNIFSKQEELLEKIKSNVQKYNFRSFKYINDPAEFKLYC